MSSLSNIIRKEIKELLTPALILPIVFIAILFGSMGNAIGGIEDQLAEPPVIGIINEDQGHLATVATEVLNQSSIIIFNGTSLADKSAGIAAVQEYEGEALIIFPQNQPLIHQLLKGFFIFHKFKIIQNLMPETGV